MNITRSQMKDPLPALTPALPPPVRERPPSPDRPDTAAQAQSMVGNAAVAHMLGSSPVQAKLTVGQPDDAYEREADQVAEQVVSRGGALSVQRKCAACNGAGTCPKCKQNALRVQRKAAAEGPDEIASGAESDIAALRGGGQALPPTLREEFEPHFGQDFSNVRVHTGGHAAELAGAMSARAFTAGPDIVFGQGQYQPGSTEGQKLLAHELTHVVQQGAATLAGPDAAPNATAISHAGTQQVQRDLLDDAQALAGSTLDKVGSVVNEAGSAISSGVSTISKGASSVIDDATTSLATAAQATASAAGGIVDWVKTEAGKLALRAANALAAKFGGSVIISPEGGIDILIGDINIAELEEETHILPLGLPVDTLFDAPFEVGTFVINTSVGTVIGDPALTTAVGPVRLQNIKLHLDPFKDVYAGTGQLFVGAEAVGTGEKALEARVQAAGVLPFEIPIPIEASAAVGIRDILRVAGKGNLRETVDLRYSGGQFTFANATELKLGALAALDHEAFLRIEIEFTEICSLIWPLSSHRLGSAGVQIDMPFLLTADGDGIRTVAGEARAAPVSVDAIETSLKNDRPADRCVGLEELAKFLCEKGKLPPEVCAIVAPAKPGSLNSPVGPIPFAPPNTGGGDGGSTAAQGSCPDPAPQPALLGIPPPRNRNIDAYRARIRQAPGPLQHQVGRERSGNFHVRLWRSLMPGRIPADVRQRGLALGLNEADLIQPYWSKTRVFSERMEVDHIVELQVATIGQEGRFDVISNYQLMEASQNGSAGGAMRQRIINMRNQLAKFGGDVWDTCDLTFDDVVSLGAETPQAWTQQELTAGEHVEAFERLGRPPRPF